LIHYHGTPITPRAQLERMGGRCFCVSFADPRDTAVCLRIGQSVMFDNGAFSAFTKGVPLVFPLMAFGGLDPWTVGGMFVAKVCGGAVWAWLLSRRAVAA
jgi:hypothetical protein